MHERVRIGIFFIWLILFPPFLYYMFQHAGELWLSNAASIAGFMILIALVSLFPVEIKGTTFIPVHGVSLAVFLHYGLFTEVLITQVAILIALLGMRLPAEDRYRFPLNSLIFLITSLFSGGAFYLAGGMTGAASFETITSQIVPVIVYTFIYFLTNNVMIYLTQRYVQKKRVTFLSDALSWEALSAVLILPVGLTLAYLYHELGMIALPMIGIPVVAVSLILKFYHDGKKLIDQLQQVSEFGHEINRLDDIDAIYDRYLQACYTMLPADGVLIFDPPEDESDRLVPVFIECPSNRTDRRIRDGDPISRRVMKSGEVEIYNSVHETDRELWSELSGNAQSFLSVPAVRKGRVTGVSTLISKRKWAFTKKHQMLLEILLNHLTISIKNVRHLKQAKQESFECGLTKLNNYRYFEQTLLLNYEDNDKTFTIILLDLDHFKTINDNYGHSAGNEMLYQVARVLEKSFEHRNDHTIARYGGEEFVILLDNVTLSEGEEEAERLRHALSNAVFQLSSDLKTERRRTISVTASVGVASRVDDLMDPLTIVRNADRAMYSGAKNQGRNKVAVY